MEAKVSYIGDNEIVDYPIIIGYDDWLIPKGWYLLDNELENRPIVVYNNKLPIIIIKHIQISHQLDEYQYRLSVIKTDKKLQVDDIIVY